MTHGRGCYQTTLSIHFHHLLTISLVYCGHHSRIPVSVRKPSTMSETHAEKEAREKREEEEEHTKKNKPEPTYVEVKFDFGAPRTSISASTPETTPVTAAAPVLTQRVTRSGLSAFQPRVSMVREVDELDDDDNDNDKENAATTSRKTRSSSRRPAATSSSSSSSRTAANVAPPARRTRAQKKLLVASGHIDSNDDEEEELKAPLPAKKGRSAAATAKEKASKAAAPLPTTTKGRTKAATTTSSEEKDENGSDKKTTASASSTLNGKSKFDLQESLAKPVTWKMKTGKVMPLTDVTNSFSMGTIHTNNNEKSTNGKSRTKASTGASSSSAPQRDFKATSFAKDTPRGASVIAAGQQRKADLLAARRAKV
jgi:hypothetical protein